MSSATKALFGQISRGRSLPLLSRFAPAETPHTTRAELAGFRRAQKLAFDCATGVANVLEPGWTEIETAEWMDAYLREHGVTTCFHRPLAWFGERSRFKGFKKAADACPGERVLKAGEVITLDLAPIVGGYVGDVGFSYAREPHAKLAEVRAFLRQMRATLPDYFASSMTTEDIWNKVDEDIKAAGFENCHAKYTFHVLGHRVHKVPLAWVPSLGKGVYSGHGYWMFLSRGLFPEILTPWHKGDKYGLWAIEPHVGVKGDDGFGAKFEEILVVTPERIYWLEDDVPHMQLPKGLY